MIHYLFSFQPVWIFLLALLATYLMRRWSPQLCYFLWIFVLIKLLLPFGVLERYIRVQDYVKTEKLSFFSQPDLDSVLVKPASVDFVENPRNETPNNPNQRLVMTAAGVRNIAPAASLRPNQLSFMNTIYNPPLAWRVAGWCVLLIWIGISLVILVSKSFAYIRFRKGLESWLEVNDGFVYQQFLYCVKLTGLDYLPKLRVAPEDYDVPFTLGIRKKSVVVIIPQSMADMNQAKKLRIMLCHELVHIKKKDWIVNVLRFLCLVLFHYHPLRLLAERFVSGFQEITTDLKTIELLKITKQEYVSLLLSKFMEVNQGLRALVLSTPFLNSEASFVKRLFFIKRHDPVQSRWPKVASYSLFGAFSLFFLVNLSLYAMIPEESTLILGSEYADYDFPTPVKTYPSILHQTVAVPKVHNEILWVLEPQYGFFGYRINDESGLKLVSSYLFENAGPNNYNEFALDFAFYEKYAYVSIVDQRTQTSELSRVEIVEIANDGSCQKVGEIANKQPQVLLIKNQSLWVAGAGEIQEEGAISIFNLQTPVNPLEIDTEYYDNIVPTVLIDFPANDQIIAAVGQDLLFFDGDSSLTPVDTVTCSGALLYVIPLDLDRIVAFASDYNDIGSSITDTQLFLLQRYEDDRFLIKKSIRLYRGDGDSDNLWIDYPLSLNQCVFSPFLNCFTCLFGMVNDEVTLLSCSPRNYSLPILYQDRLVCLKPETAIFDPKDFHLSPSVILSWKNQ